MRRRNAGGYPWRCNCRSSFAPGAGGIVVRVGDGLLRAAGFGDVPQVEADAVPDGGAAAHAVDEDVVLGEVGGGFGVALSPAG